MFKVGQKVVCIAYHAKGQWYSDDNGNCIAGPKYKDIDKIIGFDCDGFLLLEAYQNKDGYNHVHFRAIDHSFGEKLASEIEEEINEEQLVNI